MPYLTFDEFKDLSNFDIDDSEFEKLLPKASAMLDYVTNHFYQKVEMDHDNQWRVSQFKKALCAQIEYFHETEGTTYESINQVPQSFSAGRTTVTNRSDGQDESKLLVAQDVYIYLEGT